MFLVIIRKGGGEVAILFKKVGLQPRDNFHAIRADVALENVVMEGVAVGEVVVSILDTVLSRGCPVRKLDRELEQSNRNGAREVEGGEIGDLPRVFHRPPFRLQSSPRPGTVKIWSRGSSPCPGADLRSPEIGAEPQNAPVL